MLSKESLQKFIDTYHKQYGVTLTEQEAMVLANRLISLYKAVLGDPLLDLLIKNNE